MSSFYFTTTQCGPAWYQGSTCSYAEFTNKGDDLRFAAWV